MTNAEIKELLELAAKAEGHPFPWFEARGGRMHEWNPCDDDGDNRRLQVACNLDIEFTDGSVWANGVNVQNYQLFEWHKDDKCAATRFAVLRAAAAIGRAMP